MQKEDVREKDHAIRRGLEGLWAGPAAGNINPLGQTAAFLALDVDDVGVAAASTTHAVLLGRVVRIPVGVLFDPLAFVACRHLKVRVSWELSGGRVGRAVLDGRVSIAEVAEVVDIARREESTGGEGVDGRVTPL